jgi:hypothetical protein
MLPASFGPSEVVPYLHGEPSRLRHKRRLDAAWTRVDDVATWCAARSLACAWDAWGCKWRFRRPPAFAQWIPSLGRFCCSPDPRRAPPAVVKVHDVDQLFAALALWLALTEGGAT